MGFYAEVRAEIVRKLPERGEERRAFLSGYLRAAGSVLYRGGKFGFSFAADEPELADFLCEALNDLYGAEISEAEIEEDKLNRKEKIAVECFSAGAARILADLGIVTPAGELDFSLAHSFLSDDRLRRSYLRGMFLGAGYVTLPSGGGSKTGYHLEFIFSCYEVAAEFSDYLAQISVFPTLTERKEHFIVYVKSSEEIKDFFALLSLPKSVLRITDCMVEREIRGAVNRQRNCDVGNVTKQVAASEKQIAAIGKIDAAIGLSELPDALQITAKARRDYPEETLAELAERLSVTKSCLNHRLRKLVDLADELN